MQGMPDSSHELISVVIPAYNAQRTLREAIDSVRAQTWPNLEIVVVNDGSTDGTGAMLDALAGRGLRVIHQPNGGLAQARRAGVEVARGRWIALMDADDVAHPQRLAVQAEVMRRLDVVMCGTDFDAFDEHGRRMGAYAARYYSMIGQAPQGIGSLLGERTEIACADGAVPVWHGDAYRALAHGNFMHPPTLMFRRDLLDRIGGFEDGARSMCDWDFIVRAARAGRIAHVGRALLDYRLHAAQMSSPRHRARATRDTLLVSERICARDQSLYLEDLPRFLGELGFFCVDAADAWAEHDRREAARLLARSVLRYGRFDGRTLRVLAKIATPGWALSAMRHRRAVQGA
ncbi:MAG: hypothetical protein RL456_502 [Pseudomonadota bacterium]